MGIYDRDYARPYQEQHQYYSMGSGIKGLPPVVKWLLIINFLVFMVDNLIFKDLVPENPRIRFTLLDQYLSVFPVSFGTAMQLWRVITYQFLHGSVGHVFFNLFVLFIFGPVVERDMGSKTFLKFYLICGAVGGILYSLLASMGLLEIGPMVGASGAIYGVLAAVAMKYPRLRVYVMFIFPMTLFWAVILCVILSFLFILSGVNVGGELAHLAGLATGFLYIKYKPWITHRRMEHKRLNESGISSLR
jgi:membrane associated rhomboid family serine protease